MKISASFLSIEENLHKNIKKLDNTTIDYLHLDIMDGEFVNNKTWTLEEMQELLNDTTKPLDVHLMVRNVIKYIDKYKTLNPSFVTFHLEAVDNPLEIISYLKGNDIKVGISIKPDTLVDALKPYLSYLDVVLIMSVEPGIGGQEFIKDSVEKIDVLYNIRAEKKYNYMIEVDGGMDDKVAKLCRKADILVSGSYITNDNNYQKQIDKLREEKDRI